MESLCKVDAFGSLTDHYQKPIWGKLNSLAHDDEEYKWAVYLV